GQDVFDKYSQLCAWNVTARAVINEGFDNQSRTSKTYAFEKYSQLCERDVAPRLATTEDTLVGGLSSLSRLKRTCYETHLSLLVVSEPSFFESFVNEPIISGTFILTASIRAITLVLSQQKRAPEDV
nr:hypothetical protein [Tanacetum cinerariifolium]